MRALNLIAPLCFSLFVAGAAAGAPALMAVTDPLVEGVRCTLAFWPQADMQGVAAGSSGQTDPVAPTSGAPPSGNIASIPVAPSPAVSAAPVTAPTATAPPPGVALTCAEVESLRIGSIDRSPAGQQVPLQGPAPVQLWRFWDDAAQALIYVAASGPLGGLDMAVVPVVELGP